MPFSSGQIKQQPKNKEDPKIFFNDITIPIRFGFGIFDSCSFELLYCIRVTFDSLETHHLHGNLQSILDYIFEFGCVIRLFVSFLWCCCCWTIPYLSIACLTTYSTQFNGKFGNDIVCMLIVSIRLRFIFIQNVVELNYSNTYNKHWLIVTKGISHFMPFELHWFMAWWVRGKPKNRLHW